MFTPHPPPAFGQPERQALRDFFAAQAMVAYLICPATFKAAADDTFKCAEQAYMQADAMLKVREQK
jgi:hypothetical protein